MYYLTTIFIWSLFVIESSYAVRTVTLDLFDSSLSFSQPWKFGTTNGNVFRFVDELGAMLRVVLPALTSEVKYVGFKELAGSLYAVCLDCTQGRNSSLVFFDASDPTANTATPSTLFTLTLDGHPHEMTIFNVADARFNGTSRLTFVFLMLMIDDTPATQDPMPTSYPSQTGDTSRSMQVIAMTATPEPSAASSLVRNSGSLVTAVIILAIFAVTFPLLAVLFLMWIRPRYRRHHLDKENQDKPSIPMAVMSTHAANNAISENPVVMMRNEILHKTLPPLPQPKSSVSTTRTSNINRQLPLSPHHQGNDLNCRRPSAQAVPPSQQINQPSLEPQTSGFSQLSPHDLNHTRRLIRPVATSQSQTLTSSQHQQGDSDHDRQLAQLGSRLQQQFVHPSLEPQTSRKPRRPLPPLPSTPSIILTSTITSKPSSVQLQSTKPLRLKRHSERERR